MEFEKKLEEEIIDRILPNVNEYVLAKVKEVTDDAKKSIKTIKITDKKGKTKRKSTTLVHKKFDDIVLLISNNIPVMLVGGAGSGKSSTCEKVANLLGLDFYFTNAVTQEYKLTGFIDAKGQYQETQFYKAFKDGGLFCLDEIDASIPEALIIINTAIANGYMDFPCGKVVAHEDFRVVACANTYGLGSDDVYVGRNQLDGASLDRFALINFEYDETLERVLVENQEWVEFVQELRHRIQERKIKHIISMRATIYGDIMIQAKANIKDVFEQVIFKNLRIDDIKSIGTISNNNKYAKEFNKIVQSQGGAF